MAARGSAESHSLGCSEEVVEHCRGDELEESVRGVSGGQISSFSASARPFPLALDNWSEISCKRALEITVSLSCLQCRHTNGEDSYLNWALSLMA